MRSRSSVSSSEGRLISRTVLGTRPEFATCQAHYSLGRGREDQYRGGREMGGRGGRVTAALAHSLTLFFSLFLTDRWGSLRPIQGRAAGLQEAGGGKTELRGVKGT